MRIGWIGTGVMGEPMARHLMNAGHDLHIFTRTRKRADVLMAEGATWCASPAEAAVGADLVAVMAGFPDDVEDIVLSPEGVLSTLPAGACLIDFTTSSPELARRIAQAAATCRVASLDAPVSGGDVGARNASLSIMVGGGREAFDRVRPVLGVLGKTVVYQGEAGMGQHTKMVNQILIATTMVGVCEGLLYARKAGLDPATVLKSVSGGAASSWSLSNLLPRILDGDLEPGFFVEHFVKDMGIALGECERMGLNLPGLKLARELYGHLIGMDLGRKGTQALVCALEALNKD